MNVERPRSMLNAATNIRGLFRLRYTNLFVRDPDALCERTLMISAVAAIFGVSVLRVLIGG
jgi:hypothetical protein